MNLVIIGPPGVGKGTQAKLLSKKYNLLHISTGEIFRDIISNNSDIAKEIKRYIQNGRLVPDEIVSKIVIEKLENARAGVTQPLHARAGFILDGFPRNIYQLEILENYLNSKGKTLPTSTEGITYAIYIKLPEREIVKRLAGRRLCPKCKRDYNLLFKNIETCEYCNVKLIQRDDDKPKTIKKRLKIYKDETEPIIQYFKKKKKLLEIDGKGSIEEVFEKICNRLQE